MFWICDQSSVNSTLIFKLLQSSAYTKPRTFQLLTLPFPAMSWGCTRSWKRTQLGELTQTGQRSTPYHMASCSVIRAEGEKEEEKDIPNIDFCLPKPSWWALFSKQMNICLPRESSESVPCFALLAYIALLHLLNCPYLSPGAFQLSLFQFSPVPLGRSKQLWGILLPARVNPQQVALQNSWNLPNLSFSQLRKQILWSCLLLQYFTLLCFLANCWNVLMY